MKIESIFKMPAKPAFNPYGKSIMDVSLQQVILDVLQGKMANKDSALEISKKIFHAPLKGNFLDTKV